jgi:D-alanine-D-alanine ligase
MTKGLLTKKRVGVLMGGMSAERDVSVRSGLAVYQSLQEMGYNSVAIDVGKDIVNVLKKEKIKIAFLALHGGIGENGAIQGLLEVLGIPYTGSGVLASAIAMDNKSGIAETDATGAYIYPDFPVPSFELPWVVKPASEGSSIGVSIIKDEKELAPCLDKTFSLGKRAIVEKFVNGRELHIAIAGSRVLGGVEVRPSVEFYNYEAKYTSGMTEYIIPPEVDEAVYENTKNLALKAHMSIGCSGATRVDFIVADDNTPYILEINTLPGMTATSLLPKIAKSAGLGFNDLIEEILRNAIKE